MIENKNILVEYAEIISASIGGQNHRKVRLDRFYIGAEWELRKEIGVDNFFSLPTDSLPEKFRLSEKKFKSLLSRTSTYATLNNTRYINLIRITYLTRISKGMSRVMMMLKNEKK